MAATPANPLQSLGGILLAGPGLVALPFAVGLAAAAVFEVSEVVETLPTLLGLTALVLAPVLLASLVGLVLKTRAEFRYWRAQGALSGARALDIVHRHLRVVTGRGWAVLLVALGFVVLSLGMRWASFGLMAVLGLLLFYLVVGWTIVQSTFLVRSWHRGMDGPARGIERRMEPAVVGVGEAVQEVFLLRQVPIPAFYQLMIEDPLDPRLGTESRYVLRSGRSRGEVRVSGGLRRTPRGAWRLGPARIWYQDMLGITRVSVAHTASAELKVLPPFRRLEILDPPRSQDDAPDALTRPRRFASDDWFRFRDYRQGDDSRRIHWRLSLKAGRLHVRRPETRPVSSREVLVLLDSHLPDAGMDGLTAHQIGVAGAALILDDLVETWLAVARELSDRGDRVHLAAVVMGPAGPTVETLGAGAGQRSRMRDLGARVVWQGRHGIASLAAAAAGTGGSSPGPRRRRNAPPADAIVVTARFASPPRQLGQPGRFTWVYLDPVASLGPPEASWIRQMLGLDRGVGAFLRRLVQLPWPAGSGENAPWRRARALRRLRLAVRARTRLRKLAQARGGSIERILGHRGEALYRLQRQGDAIRLVGERARRRTG